MEPFFHQMTALMVNARFGAQWLEARFVMTGVELTEHDVVMLPGSEWAPEGGRQVGSLRGCSAG